MNDEAHIIRHITVRGKVQGVGYRAFVEHEAILRGIEGWVRNRRDGAVEAVFAGPPRVVGAMLELCRVGPPDAWIDKVEHEECDPDKLALRWGGERFSVLPTV